MNFEIQSMVLGMVGTNCYLLINKDTKETVIFDPGAQGDKIVRYLQREELIPKAILLTHGHFDHIMGIPPLKEAYDLPVYIHRQEEAVMESPPVKFLCHDRCKCKLQGRSSCRGRRCDP